jgi:alkylation response protein AidB-like acyl-CoA dehydrogenase
MMRNVAAKLISRRDLEFLLYEWLDVEQLCARPRYADHSRETFDSVLSSAERIAVERFLPHRRKADLEEPSFDGEHVRLLPEIQAALAAFADAGLLAATCDYELGGMQLPVVVDKAAFAWFGAANVATTGYALLTICNAHLLRLARRSMRRAAHAVGQGHATMCLSEPQAGSSLADIATRAEPDGTSPLGPRYRLYGSKMWISGGENELTGNIVHLVLAKISGAPAGVKGISLFAVPRRLVAADGTPGARNDVALAGLNHKMGYRGIVNTLLSFGEGRFRPEDRAGAIGYVLASRTGLACMFHIWVRRGSASVSARSLVMLATSSRSITPAPAAGRPPDARSGRRTGRNFRHADVRRMLPRRRRTSRPVSRSTCTARGSSTSESRAHYWRRRAGLLLDLLTPIAKSGRHRVPRGERLAIQVHGGYGYTRDFVEQLYRDNRLNPIHEGTHGISHRSAGPARQARAARVPVAVRGNDIHDRRREVARRA